VNKLLVNKIKTPDGTVLVSRFRHDYVTYIDENGLEYMVDGGLAYHRCNIQKDAPHEDLCVWSEDQHEKIRTDFEWGGRGIRGDQPLTYKPLMAMSDDHIKAILKTQQHISEEIRKIFETELEYRKTL